MLERQTAVLDAMRSASVERLRFRSRPEGIRVVAAAKDGDWVDASALLPAADGDIAEIAALFRLGGHERLEIVYRAEIGLRFLCAVHNTTRGPGAGGLRRRDLITAEIDVIADTLNLARAMTYKNAVAELPRGGSKLAIHGSPLPEYDRDTWLRIIVEEIDLSGTLTGPDSGFPAGVYQDLARLTTNVTGVRAGGTSHSAAFGVGLAVRATVAALGLPLNECRIAIQGLGGLGSLLAADLAREGANLTVTDLDHRRIDAFLSGLPLNERKQVGVVAPYQILEVQTDVLAPCAVGGIIASRQVSALRCRAICGGANNQLCGQSLDDELRLARQLHDAGILYVPDWMASAGGTLHGTMEAASGDDFDPRKCQARVRRVCGWLVDEVLDEAKRTGRAPLEIAVERFLR